MNYHSIWDKIFTQKINYIYVQIQLFMIRNLYCCFFFLTVLFSTCKKKSADPAPSVIEVKAPAPTQPDYFSAVIDGKGVLIEAYNTQSLSDRIYGDAIVLSRSGVFLTLPRAYRQSLTISFYKFFPDKAEVNGEKVYEIMAPGTYSYTYRDTARTVTGVSIQWIDANRVTWSTNKSSMDQSASTFEVTSCTDFIADTIPVKIEAKFSCTLYNDEGKSISLKSGSYKGFGGPLYTRPSHQFFP